MGQRPPGEPGARRARRGSAGRPHRAGPRRWRRHSRASRGNGRRVARRPQRAAGGVGDHRAARLDYARRGQPDGERDYAVRVCAGVARAVHARTHDAGEACSGRSRARRSRRAGQIREAAMSFSAVEQAIADIRAGKLVIVADDERRENEGDLIGAAEKVSPAMINFMATHARGLICMPLTPERCQALGLPQMTEHNNESHETAFTISIDAAARFGVTTGISAADRAATIRVAIDPSTVPSDLRRPGHVFPLRARPGGVLQRVGQTEASIDLARLADLYPAGVICEILNPDGTMARRPDLERFARDHGLTFITVAQLVAYRLKHERLVHRVAEARLPTPFGEFRIIGYRNDVDQAEHIALVYGAVAGKQGVLVRMHSKCLTGDVFGSARCDCGWQLHSAM